MHVTLTRYVFALNAVLSLLSNIKDTKSTLQHQRHKIRKALSRPNFSYLSGNFSSCVHKISRNVKKDVSLRSVWAVKRIIWGRSVGKIILILSFRVNISKNKNFHQKVKETGAIMSTKVTYEINLISLPWDSTISCALNFCFLCILS